MLVVQCAVAVGVGGPGGLSVLGALRGLISGLLLSLFMFKLGAIYHLVGKEQ